MPNSLIQLIGYEQKRPYVLNEQGFMPTGPTQTTLHLGCGKQLLVVQAAADTPAGALSAFLREATPADPVPITDHERLIALAIYIDELLSPTVPFYRGYEVERTLGEASESFLTFKAALSLDVKLSEERKANLSALIDALQLGRGYKLPYFMSNTDERTKTNAVGSGISKYEVMK